MAQFQTGHLQDLVRHSSRHGRPLHNLGDQIEGRHHVPPPKTEPVLIRQKQPPTSVRDAKPAAPDKTQVRCRQIIKGGQAQTVPITRAKNHFQSHQLKCQGCAHRMQCATA